MKVAMRVFISFAREDAEFAARLEKALRARQIECWSSLDAPAGERWQDSVYREGLRADALISVVGPHPPLTDRPEYERRAFLRGDWESRKTGIPVLIEPSAESNRPRFLRGRKAIVCRSFARFPGGSTRKGTRRVRLPRR